MGGRGASSGVVGRSRQTTPPPPPIPQRRRQAQQAQPATQQPTAAKSVIDDLRDQYSKQSRTSVGGVKGDYSAGYTDENNAQLVKYQGQTEDKTRRFLSNVQNQTDYNNYPDKFKFYENHFQKLTLRLGLNKKPMVLSEKEFNQVVKQNNLQVLYRGESGQAQCDRFMNADYSHPGIGSYGDGYYFSDMKSVANRYANYKGGVDGRVEKLALSPSAKCITYSQLMRRWRALTPSERSMYSRYAYNSGADYSSNGEAQFALKLGYNVVTNVNGNDYHYALTRDAFIVCETVKHNW